MLKKLSLMLASVVSVFAMHTAEININDKDLELGAKLDMGQFNETIEPDTTFVGISFLNGNDENSEGADGNATDVNPYYEVSFLMKREVRNSGVYIGIGVKSNFTKVSDKAYMTIPLGLELTYKVPVEVPVKLTAKVYYAPESLAFENADSFLESRIDASVELIERGSIIAGFRTIETNFNVNAEVHEIIYNSAAYFGFRFDF